MQVVSDILGHFVTIYCEGQQQISLVKQQQYQKTKEVHSGAKQGQPGTRQGQLGAKQGQPGTKKGHRPNWTNTVNCSRLIMMFFLLFFIQQILPAKNHSVSGVAGAGK